ncbi:MAG TPA: hypothetical protein VMZ03_13700 [Chitinophagaceae bacterium]|nr:hypothetical protein [Chitinophagaceae bacterium]
MIPCNIITYCGKLIFFLLLLCFSFCAGAQSYEDTTAAPVIEEVTDTSYTVGEEKTDQQKSKFLQLSEMDSFTVTERQLPPGHAKKMKGDKDFWYADSEIQKKEKKQEDVREESYRPLGQRGWFQTLLWLVIIGAFAGAIMWYLAESNVGIFRKKDVTATGDSMMEDLPEDIFAINYQREIEKAAAQENYRLAVRLMYLRLLKDLAHRNIIQYKQDKTNFDYLLQLHSTRYYSSFFRLTRHYEYSWYGHFDVEEDAFKIIRGEFHQFDKEIG